MHFPHRTVACQGKLIDAIILKQEPTPYVFPPLSYIFNKPASLCQLCLLGVTTMNPNMPTPAKNKNVKVSQCVGAYRRVGCQTPQQPIGGGSVQSGAGVRRNSDGRAVVAHMGRWSLSECKEIGLA